MWDWKLLEGSYGQLGSALRNYFVRGAISTVGLLSLRVGLIEAAAFVGLLKREPQP
jgi:hypothetical protein